MNNILNGLSFSIKLLSESLPVVIPAFLIFTAFGYLYIFDPLHRGLPSIDHWIVEEQIIRSHQINDVDLLLIGDSSCLMGVDPTLLGRSLGNITVESFCIIGFAGPVAVDQLLRNFLERGRKAGTIVFLMHGASMDRDPSWDTWVPQVIRGVILPPTPETFYNGALRKIGAAVGHLIYLPLPKNYGRYYGSEYAFRSEVRKNHGAVISPNIFELTDVPENWNPFSHVMDDAFREALAPLSNTFSKFSLKNVFTVITPIPETLEGVNTQPTRQENMKEMAHLLGLDSKNILNVPGTMSESMFADFTHLSPTGRKEYTLMIAEALRPRLNQ